MKEGKRTVKTLFFGGTLNRPEESDTFLFSYRVNSIWWSTQLTVRNAVRIEIRMDYTELDVSINLVLTNLILCFRQFLSTIFKSLLVVWKLVEDWDSKMLRDVWGWEGTDAMYMFKNWEEEYLECYTSFTSVCSGGGNWEGRVVPTKKNPTLILCA